jgi:hypothetical protein
MQLYSLPKDGSLAKLLSSYGSENRNDLLGYMYESDDRNEIFGTFY